MLAVKPCTDLSINFHSLSSLALSWLPFPFTFYMFLVSFKNCLNPLPLAPGGFFIILFSILFLLLLFRVLVSLLCEGALPQSRGLLLPVVLGQREPARGLQLRNVVVDGRVDFVVLLCRQNSDVSWQGETEGMKWSNPCSPTFSDSHQNASEEWILGLPRGASIAFRS